MRTLLVDFSLQTNQVCWCQISIYWMTRVLGVSAGIPLNNFLLYLLVSNLNSRTSPFSDLFFLFQRSEKRLNNAMNLYTAWGGELYIWVLQGWDGIIRITYKHWSWVERQGISCYSFPSSFFLLSQHFLKIYACRSYCLVFANGNFYGLTLQFSRLLAFWTVLHGRELVLGSWTLSPMVPYKRESQLVDLR